VTRDLDVNITLTSLTLPPPTPGNISINVTVTDAKTGMTLAGATVTIGGYQYKTGSNGICSLNVTRGNYTLAVSMNGYETKTISVNAMEEKTYSFEVSLSPRVPTPTIIFTAALTSTTTEEGYYDNFIQIQSGIGTSKITAAVTRSDGTAAAGVAVSFTAPTQPEWANWMTASFDSSTAITDSTGRASVLLTVKMPGV
jgi:hypothetical protein